MMHGSCKDAVSSALRNLGLKNAYTTRSLHRVKIYLERFSGILPPP
uniref:Uncharacterized protein n=1 Tax=Setaria italica TaxID=4555 RepID=K4ANX8_SETIT